jgi:hypothetical protein
VLRVAAQADEGPAVFPRASAPEIHTLLRTEKDLATAVALLRVALEFAPQRRKRGQIRDVADHDEQMVSFGLRLLVASEPISAIRTTPSTLRAPRTKRSTPASRYGRIDAVKRS